MQSKINHHSVLLKMTQLGHVKPSRCLSSHEYKTMKPFAVTHVGIFTIIKVVLFSKFAQPQVPRFNSHPSVKSLHDLPVFCSCSVVFLT